MSEARDDRMRAVDQDGGGEDEEHQLTKQTPGLDAGVTDAIAGPDWDPELVEEARASVAGEPMDGEVERGPSDPGAATQGPTASARAASDPSSTSGDRSAS